MVITEARNAQGMLYGAYIGKIKYLMDTVENSGIEELDDSTSNINLMTQILNSINTKDHVCPKDICDRISDTKYTGSILYAISPLAFADIFGLHHKIDNTIVQIASAVNSLDETNDLCIEYIHLLHDILWFKIDKDEILEILPELDVLESEVVCSDNEQDVFFAALWSFIFSDDYASCYEKAANLKNTNSDIVGLACTFAGLYYGVGSIPTDWAVQVFESCPVDEGDIDSGDLPVLKIEQD